MAKNLLNESTVRRWGSLAQIAPLTENFIEERSGQFTEGEDPLEENEEPLEEDNYDKTGPGPHREGTGKNNHDGESGVAQNQGKEPPESPDGKLEIPGTSYAGDHKNKNKSPEKGSTDGGTQLHGKGNVTEGLNEMPEMEDEMGGPDMGADMPPEGGMEGGADLEKLVGAIANAISQETGVEINVAGHAEPDGDEELPPPVDDEPPMGEPPAEMGMGDEGGEYEEEDEVVENKPNLSEIDDALFQEEAYKRGYKKDEMYEDKGVQEEGDDAVQREAMVESIAKKVAAKLAGGNKTAKRRAKK